MATRKLKLQVQMTVDGFVAGPEGQLYWMTRNLDEGVIQGRPSRLRRNVTQAKTASASVPIPLMT